MTRTMYDSVTVASIPAAATMVAGYVDGRYQTIDELRGRFPHATVVTITVTGRSRAHIVDIEQGDCTPQSGVAAVKAGIAEGCYASASVVGQVLAQIDAQGVSRDTPIWTAHYTNTPHLCDAGCYGPVPFTPNIVATQYLADHNGYDASLVADYWPGVDSAPTGGDDVQVQTLQNGDTATSVAALRCILNGYMAAAGMPRSAHNPLSTDGPGSHVFDANVQGALQDLEKHWAANGVPEAVAPANFGKCTPFIWWLLLGKQGPDPTKG